MARHAETPVRRAMQRNMIAAARRAAVKARARRTRRQLQQAARDAIRDWYKRRFVETFRSLYE